MFYVEIPRTSSALSALASDSWCIVGGMVKCLYVCPVVFAQVRLSSIDCSRRTCLRSSRIKVCGAVRTVGEIPSRRNFLKWPKGLLRVQGRAPIKVLFPKTLFRISGIKVGSKGALRATSNPKYILTRHRPPKPTLFIFGETRTPQIILESIWEHPGKILSLEI